MPRDPQKRRSRPDGGGFEECTGVAAEHAKATPSPTADQLPQTVARLLEEGLVFVARGPHGEVVMGASDRLPAYLRENPGAPYIVLPTIAARLGLQVLH
jgi:hypothetical protein